MTKRRRPRVTTGIDLDALNKRPDRADIKLIDPISEGDHRAKAGEKAARVLQRNIDRYFERGRIDAAQYAGAIDLYDDHRRSLGSNASFDGAFVSSAFGSRSVSERQMIASLSFARAIDAIRIASRPVIKHVVVEDHTIGHYRNAYCCGNPVAWRLFRAGLDDLASFYKHV